MCCVVAFAFLRMWWVLKFGFLRLAIFGEYIAFWVVVFSLLCVFLSFGFNRMCKFKDWGSSNLKVKVKIRSVKVKTDLCKFCVQHFCTTFLIAFAAIVVVTYLTSK